MPPIVLSMMMGLTCGRHSATTRMRRSKNRRSNCWARERYVDGHSFPVFAFNWCILPNLCRKQRSSRSDDALFMMAQFTQEHHEAERTARSLLQQDDMTFCDEDLTVLNIHSIDVEDDAEFAQQINAELKSCEAEVFTKPPQPSTKATQQVSPHCVCMFSCDYSVSAKFVHRRKSKVIPRISILRRSTQIRCPAFGQWWRHEKLLMASPSLQAATTFSTMHASIGWNDSTVTNTMHRKQRSNCKVKNVASGWRSHRRKAIQKQQRETSRWPKIKEPCPSEIRREQFSVEMHPEYQQTASTYANAST